MERHQCQITVLGTALIIERIIEEGHLFTKNELSAHTWLTLTYTPALLYSLYIAKRWCMGIHVPPKSTHTAKCSVPLRRAW